jgi:hypothetical protein
VSNAVTNAALTVAKGKGLMQDDFDTLFSAGDLRDEILLSLKQAVSKV